MQTEHAFWLHILEDHIHFMKDALLDTEQSWKTTLDKQLTDWKHLYDSMSENVEYAQHALNWSKELHRIKRDLLYGRVTNTVEIRLKPTFISHMIRELNIYIFILEEYIESGKVPKLVNIDHHDTWALDAHGHLQILLNHIDPVEDLIRKRVKESKGELHSIWMKTLEFMDYIRQIGEFEGLKQLDLEAIDGTKRYLALISELTDLYDKELIESDLTTRMLNHMYDEQSYYLKKLEGY